MNDIKQLIAKFHEVTLTPAEYAAIEDYLFGTGVRPPLQHGGLALTVEYLKNVSSRNGLQSLADLEKYYSDMRARMRRFFDELNQRTNN